MRTQVKGHSALVKDRRSGAVINTDKAAYNEEMRRRESVKAQAARIDALEQKVDHMVELLERLVHGKP